VYNGKLFSYEQDGILSFATTGMELEMIMLSEINWGQKDKYQMLSHVKTKIDLKK
jgi:hypothetical protein